MAFAPSAYQEGIFQFIKDPSAKNGIVGAVAGSGKTTTIIQAARFLDGKTAIFLAFNKHIAEHLNEKLRGTSMAAKTVHAIGFGCISRTLGNRVKLNVKDGKYYFLCREHVQTYLVRQAGTEQRQAIQTLRDLCDMARLTLTDPRNRDAMIEQIDHYGIEIDFRKNAPVSLYEYLAACEEVIRSGNDMANRGDIDYIDMVYLVDRWNLTPPQVDWVFVDECQDLNVAMANLAMKCAKPGTGRVIAVGDPKQAIMGFAFADSNSFFALADRLNAKELPLNICYRCPKSHVDLARSIVPAIEARPDAPEGTIDQILPEKIHEYAKPGDLVLSRVTAPLIAECINFIKRKIPAFVRGRDIGKQLTVILEKLEEMTGFNYKEFPKFLDRYYAAQMDKLAQRENNESAMTALRDKIEAITACYEEFSDCTTIKDLTRALDSLFDEKTSAIEFSTIHKAKGSENHRVIIMAVEKLPLTWPKQQPWEREQEINLLYVALTRSQETLCIAGAPDWYHKPIEDEPEPITQDDILPANPNLPATFALDKIERSRIIERELEEIFDDIDLDFDQIYEVPNHEETQSTTTTPMVQSFTLDRLIGVPPIPETPSVTNKRGRGRPKGSLDKQKRAKKGTKNLGGLDISGQCTIIQR